MIINRNSSNKSEAIERIEFNNDATKFERDAQYLVTLKMRNRRTQRNTDIPSGSSTSAEVSMSSTIDPQTTKQSKRLNNETK